MQGNYELFQCSRACHNKTYDNKNYIEEMVKMKFLHIPKSPKFGESMTTNLRCDDTFVEDKGWHLDKKDIITF